jgi:hypothetical protein
MTHDLGGAGVDAKILKELNLTDTNQCQNPGLARLVFSQAQPRARAIEAGVMRRYRRARLNLDLHCNLRNQVRFRMTY